MMGSGYAPEQMMGHGGYLGGGNQITDASGATSDEGMFVMIED